MEILLSLPSELTGWLHVLFSYLKPNNKLEPNPYLQDWAIRFEKADKRTDWREVRDSPQGPALDVLPSGLASAPVRLLDTRSGKPHQLQWIGGLFGVAQHPSTQTLSPEFGWAVVYANK